MTKIICRSMDHGILQSNEYTTPKGNSYNFYKGRATDVKDKDDAAYFLKCIHYEKYSAVKEKLLKTNAKKKKAEKLTKTDVYALNKAEQRKLIQRLGGSMHRIPFREKDRVEMILKLQEED